MNHRIGDLRDAASLSRTVEQFQPEIVLHLAAQSLVRKSYRSPVDTYAVNVMGTVHLLESLRHCESVQSCVVVTTDKCYHNQSWVWGYRETDRLGGHDPYSNSKACSELVTDAYRRSFLAAADKLVATARAGNVIGGGDLAEDRLVPDAYRAFSKGEKVTLRNPLATRPWQHVLDPLCGYLLLAEALGSNKTEFAQGFNFGPDSEHSVGSLVELLVDGWGDGVGYQTESDTEFHEAICLHLDSSLARAQLKWRPLLSFEEAAQWTISFYRQRFDGRSARDLVERDLDRYGKSLVKR